MKIWITLLFLLLSIKILYGQPVDTTGQQTLDEQVTQISDSATAIVEKSEQAKPPNIYEIISFPKIFWSLMFILGGYIVINILTRILSAFAERSAKYRITIKAFVPVIKILGWIFIIFIIIVGIFKPPAATVLAFSASIGVAVGFASQDFLKNVFGGIMILLDRPFKVGDKIEVGEHYGEVQEIGLRSTRIVTQDDSLVSLPNHEIMNKSVSNSNTGAPNCQVVAEIYLPVNVDTSKAREIAIEAAQVSRYIYLKKPIVVLFSNEVKERKSYLKMRLKAYVMDIRDEFAFKSDMTETTIREFIRHGIFKPEDVSQ